MFFLVEVFGMFHGFVFLPVILSLIGPKPYGKELTTSFSFACGNNNTDKKKENKKEENENKKNENENMNNENENKKVDNMATMLYIYYT